MAIKRIVVDDTTVGTDKPWLSEFLKGKKPESIVSGYTVEVCFFTQKGCILETPSFKCFLWKSVPMYNFLVEALNVWVPGKKEVDSLVVIVDLSLKDKFTLGIDDEMESLWVKKGENTYRTVESLESTIDADFLPVSGNPLLTIAPSSSLPTEEKVRRKGKAGQ